MAPLCRDLDPLPLVIRDGMIPMGIFGMLSSISTLGLMIFITHRMIFWRRYFDHPIATNQVFVLIYNLLLADFQQALAFAISFYWISQNKLVRSSPACYTQGWLVQIGDISSGLWVLTIAIHTFINLVCQRQIPHKVFIMIVVGLWMFCLFLTAIGPMTSKDKFFVPAGAWCWMSETHESERLYLHYIWIFMAQFGSLVIYISIFFVLRARLAKSSKLQQAASESASTDSRGSPYKGGPVTTTIIVSPVHDGFAMSRQRILRTARYLVVYPFAYVLFTLPLATGRLATMAGKNPPVMLFPLAGSMMACCGIIDVMLYLKTRKVLIKSSVGDRSSSSGLARFGGPDSRKRGARGQSIRLGGLRDEEHGSPPSAENPEPLDGTIMVSKSVVMSAEPEDSERSGSIQSVSSVLKEENPYDF